MFTHDKALAGGFGLHGPALSPFVMHCTANAQHSHNRLPNSDHVDTTVAVTF